METLVLVHHGKGNNEGCLSSLGILQMAALISRLGKKLNPDSICILSSPIGRAWESACMISSYFAVPCISHHILNETHYKDEELLEVVESIEEKQLILVTHEEVVKDFPNYFITAKFNTSFPQKDTDVGSAVYMDLKNRKYRVL